MTTIPTSSGFWTHGQLAPYHLTRFNVQNVVVDSGAQVEVFVAGIAVWSFPGSNLARSVEEAHDFMELVVASYTLRTGVALDFTFTGWVEAREASFQGTVIGFTAPRGHRPRMDAQGRRSTDMRAAIELAAATFRQGPWRLAIRDIHSAYLALPRSDDAFVFAYRAIEDLAWAASATGNKSWSDLHALLGTTRDAQMRRTRRLRLARDAVTHGEENNADLIAARPHARRIVGTARSLVRLAVQNSPSLPTT